MTVDKRQPIVSDVFGDNQPMSPICPFDLVDQIALIAYSIFVVEPITMPLAYFGSVKLVCEYVRIIQKYFPVVPGSKKFDMDLNLSDLRPFTACWFRDI